MELDNAYDVSTSIGKNGMRQKKKSLSALKKKCWAVFSEYVRRKDADVGGTVNCVTCGKLMFWKDAHAGHAIPGRHNAVLFDEEIVKPQCPQDNLYKGGMYHVFVTKLIKENGMEWWEKKLEDSRKIVKYTRTDIEDLIKLYEAKLDDLK